MADIPRLPGRGGGKNGKSGTLYPAAPGYSANPAGPKPGYKTRGTIAKKWLGASQKYRNPITGETETLTQEDIMTLSQLKQAREGDTAAYKALLDSAYGAPKQEIEQTISETPAIDIESLSEATQKEIAAAYVAHHYAQADDRPPAQE